MPDEGDDFKMAGAYVEVRLKDQTEADEKALRARLESSKPVTLGAALEDPENAQLVKEKIERETKPKIKPEVEDVDSATKEKFKEDFERGTKPKITPEVVNPIDDAWRRKIQASIKATSAAALNVPVTPDTELFRQDLDATLRKVTALASAKIPVEPGDAAKFRAQLDAMIAKADAGIKATIPVEVDDKKADDSAKKAGAKVDDEMTRVAKRANAQFDGLKFLGLSVGLPAAAAIGAVGVAAALTLVTGGIAALGVSMVASNEQVQTSLYGLTSQVESDAHAMAQPLEGEVVQAIGSMSDSWMAVRPAVEDAMKGSAPAVRELSGAATDFAKNVMPGVVDAVDASEAPLQGFRSLVGQTGTGLSNMFTNMSKDGPQAGAAMRDLGGITENLLGQTGTLLGNLAGGAHMVLPQFGGAIDQVFGVVNHLTSNGMPALTGTTSGFLGTVGGGLNIVNGMASALGGWAAPVGQLGGSLLATNSIAKLFGTSLTDTGFGLKAFSSYTDAAGKSTTPFKAAMDGVEGKTNKLKAGLSSVVDSGFNPLGLALTAGGLLFDLWGQKSQEAAAKAAAFNATVADIKGTLSSTGAITANTKSLAANDIATGKLGGSQKTASDLAGEYHVNINTLTSAYTGNTRSLGQVTTELNSNVDAVAQATLRQDDWNRLQHDGISALDLTQLALGKSAGGYSDLADLQAHYNNQVDQGSHNTAAFLGDLSKATQGQRDLATEVKRQADATAEAQRQMRQLGDATSFTGEKLRLSAADSAVMSGSLAVLGDATKSVTDQGSALGTILDQLSGKVNTLSAAQAASTKSFDDADKYIKQVNDSGGKLKGTFSDLVNGQGGINGLTAKGASLEGVFQTLSNTMGSEVAATFAQSQASGDGLAGSLGKVEDVTQRTRDKFIDAATAAGLTKTQAGQLADKLGLIPSEVAIQFAAKGDQQLQDRLLDLTHQIGALPPGKSIALTANDKDAVDALAALGDQVVQLPDGSFKVFADTQAGKDAAEALRNEITHYDPVVAVHANTDDATGSVTQWQQRTDGTFGMTTTDTRTDPATGKVQAWMAQANGTWGWTNLNSRTDPATGKVQGWVQYANGSWGWVNVDANTSAAKAAIAEVTAPHYMTIYTRVQNPDGSFSSSTARYNAEGALLTRFAKGGIAAYAGGGQRRLTPMAGNVAQVVPPDTWRVIGDNMRFPEAYIPLDPHSARSQALVDEANARMGRTAVASPSRSVEQHFHIYPPADSSPDRIAAQVSAEVGWSMRGG